MNGKRIGGVLALSCAFLVVSCGKEEGTVEAATPEPLPVHAGLAPNPEMLESEHFTGRVILREALATGPGSLFVTVGPANSPMPYLMRKFDLDGPAVQPGPDGSRLVPFELTSADNFMGKPVPAEELELKVRFDYDGFVETKVDSVSTSQVVAAGARDLEVTMHQAPAYNPAEDD